MTENRRKDKLNPTWNTNLYIYMSGFEMIGNGKAFCFDVMHQFYGRDGDGETVKLMLPAVCGLVNLSFQLLHQK